MAVQQRYPTKPIECWGKLEDLRRRLVRDTYSARERGEIVVLGGPGPLPSLLCGLGGFQLLSPMPIGPDMQDLRLLTKMNELATAQGYGNDCCATLRIALGSMMMDRFGMNKRTGEIMKPDIHFESLACQGQMKAQQLYQEYYSELPSYVVELPWQEESRQADVDYLESQLHEAVEWLQKTTGREYDDKLLAEGWINEWRSRIYFSRIMEHQAAIPAPIDQKTMASFATLMWRGAMHLPEVMEFYKEAADEVGGRAKDGIAALATERCRLFHEGPVPWYPSNVLRYFNRYGAVCIGSWLYTTEFGNFNINDDGSWDVCPMPEDMGLPLKTRDDILHSMAVVFTTYNPRPKMSVRIDNRVAMSRHFKLDGAVFALDRGCLGNTCGAMESIVALKEAGIPVMSYEGACANPSELDQGEVISRIDAFMESLGLEALDEGRPLLQSEL
ncbi:MAG: 2-hydroxyacyl-CoA dehydratase family protein [Dehalococcoidia bacterium]|nr:2-hydroxyacyl-CoA dehydratase family protein [Dehalococcoidia bacterium]